MNTKWLMNLLLWQKNAHWPLLTQSPLCILITVPTRLLWRWRLDHNVLITLWAFSCGVKINEIIKHWWYLAKYIWLVQWLKASLFHLKYGQWLTSQMTSWHLSLPHRLHCLDRIEGDVTQLKYLTYKVASVRVRVCACAVEINPGLLRAACFDDVRVWTRKWFALQDGDFS